MNLTITTLQARLDAIDAALRAIETKRTPRTAPRQTTVVEALSTATRVVREGDPSLTEAQALARVFEIAPEMYLRYRDEIETAPERARLDSQQVAHTAESALADQVERLREARPTLSLEQATAEVVRKQPELYALANCAR